MLDVSVTQLPPTYDYYGPGWRGMKFRFKDAKAHFPKGKVICWSVFKSITTDRNLMEDSSFCGQNAEPKGRTIFQISNVKGKSVKLFSPYAFEEEVLVRPVSFFEVTDVMIGDQLPGPAFLHADIVYLEMLDWDQPRTEAGAWEIVRKLNEKQKKREQSNGFACRNHHG